MAGANRASRLRDDSSAALKAATSGSIFALPAAHLVMVMALRRGSPGNRSARVRIRVHSLRQFPEALRSPSDDRRAEWQVSWGVCGRPVDPAGARTTGNSSPAAISLPTS